MGEREKMSNDDKSGYDTVLDLVKSINPNTRRRIKSKKKRIQKKHSFINELAKTIKESK